MSPIQSVGMKKGDNPCNKRDREAVMVQSSDSIVTILNAEPSVGCTIRFHWIEKQAPVYEYVNV